MKLIIRDEKPEKEPAVLVWLEYAGANIVIKSEVPGKLAEAEVVLDTEMRARIEPGNFKWE